MSQPRSDTMRILLLLSLGTLALAPASADAAAPLGWSAPATVDLGQAPSAISCPAQGLCVAVDRSGEALVSSDPAAGGASWSAPAMIDPGHALTAVSCASTQLCVAVDDAGGVLTSTAPASDGHWSRRSIDGAHALTGVSCASPSLCVAVDDAGDVLTSGEPAVAAWSAAVDVDGAERLQGVSCPSGSLCVAVDDAGGALASSEPTGGAGAWHRHTIDAALTLSAVSCAANGLCTAVDEAGDALASSDASAAAPTWSSTPIDLAALSAVSCAASGLCVALDADGAAFASDDAGTPAPVWSTSSADPGVALTGAACLAEGFCAAVDAHGRALTAFVPAPAVETGAASEVTSTAATLAGAVNPNDAALSDCSFEYGTSVAYGQSAPCASVPPAGDAAQAVGARLSGLAPGSTYHYRLLARNGAGPGFGADATFTTQAITVVHPRPSISGVPAVGERLTCNTGVPSDTPATFAYAWWRDETQIAAANGAVYRVASADATHHLQCAVTATDAAGSASARSAFVSVPAAGVPAAIGETAVGAARVRGARVEVPLTCSSRAPHGCSIALALTTRETLRGTRVIAVAASAHASTRHVTATLGASRANLTAGQRRTLVLALNSSARALLAHERRVPAQLTVRGTVIGVLSAQLSSQRLTLTTASGARARRRAAHRTRAAAARAAPRSTPAAAVLAPTPYMGWDTYFAFGAHYSESTVLEAASELLSDGLAHEGYRYVWLDVGWWQGQRNSRGEIVVNHKQWPHGMAWLAQTLHEAGLRVGLYTDAGAEGCGGAHEGSYGHYRQDANTFAAWGFDAVKVDFCGGVRLHLAPQATYASFHAALADNASHRPMLLSICNFLEPEQFEGSAPAFGQSAFASYTFGPSVGNSWRTDTDVGAPGDVPFASVLRNLDADAAHPEAAGPGHWNDPDYLGPDQGLTAAQFRTQLSMWAMLAAPLMVSDNLASISPAALQALVNPQLVAIDQDPAGVQGRLVASSGDAQVWVKPLSDGSRAVALLNRSTASLPIDTSAAAIGMPAAAAYSVRDVWSNTMQTTSGALSAVVPGDSTVLLRVSPAQQPA